MKQDLVNLTSTIFKNSNNCYEIDYLNQFIEELSKYSFAEIIFCIVTNPEISFEELIEFILASPSLWINITIEEWISIMHTLNPRPKPFSREIFDKGYVDIHFLCKYLGINAINIFLQEKEINVKDKKKILYYFKKISSFLFIDDIELEDLNGDYYVDKHTLHELQSKFVRLPGIESFSSTEKQLKELLEKELQKVL